MTDIAPGWYRDPVDPAIQRYWDGESYLGDPLPADVTPPPGPPGGAPPGGAPPAGAWRPGPPGSWRPSGRDLATADPPPSAGGPAANAAPPVDRPAPATQEPGAPGYAGPKSPAQGVDVLPGQPTAPPPHPGLPYGGPPYGPGWPTYPRLVLPPPRPHGYDLAGLGARFVARMIDTLAVLGLNVLVNGWFVYQWFLVNQPYFEEFTRRMYAGESTAGIEPPQRGSTLMLIILVLATALWFAYEVPAVAESGQTLGKRLTRIKVMRVDSVEKLGFRRSMRRWNTIGLPTLLWGCFGLGFLLQLLDCLWAVFDRPLHQARHDKLAITVVVSLEPAHGGPA